MEQQVNSSTDYSKFEFIDKNRKVDRATLNRLVDSMKRNPHLVSLNPILVNESLKIFDGQHRFEACKQLGLPVYYLKSPLLKESDIIDLNKDRKNWTLDNYIKYHVLSCNDNFIKLVSFSSKTSLTISMSCLFLGLNRKSLIKEIKEGSLIFPALDIEEKSEYKAKKYKEFIKNLSNNPKTLKKICSYSFGECIALLPQETDIDKFFDRLITYIDSLPQINGSRDYLATFKALQLI